MMTVHHTEKTTMFECDVTVPRDSVTIRVYPEAMCELKSSALMILNKEETRRLCKALYAQLRRLK